MKRGIIIFLFVFIISIGISLAGNYGAGAYGRGTYGTGEAADVTTAAPVETGGGSYSGAPPSPTAFSSITSVNVEQGELAALSIAQSASLIIKNVEHLVDIKEIGEDFVRLWIYSEPEPVEIILKVGKRAHADIDNDTIADVSIELRGIDNGYAFLYFKELKGVKEIKLPKGEKVVEEKITGEQVIELPKIKLEVKKTWAILLEGFENFVKNNVDYLINNVKAKKSWLIPSLIVSILLLSFFIMSLRFCLKKKS